jgi:hypothetical protein
MLARHYLNFQTYSQRLRDKLELVVCDDASEELMPECPRTATFRCRRFRIEPPHVPWSHRVASNIAADNAGGEWLLLTDIDHMVPSTTFAGLLESVETYDLNPNTAYTFQRVEYSSGASYKPHPDSWFFHRTHWETVGGYDERYRGYYGQNYAFIERVRAAGRVKPLPLPLVRVSRDDIPDASERTLTRKSEEAKAAVATLRRDFKRDGTFLARARVGVPYVELCR